MCHLVHWRVLEAGSWVHRRYRIVAPLGKGGMGSVYLVDDAVRGERCVLKQVESERPELTEALRHEFALLSSVTHPHLARVRDFGIDRSSGRPVPYYTADFVDGVPLAEWAERQSDVEGPWLD